VDDAVVAAVERRLVRRIGRSGYNSGIAVVQGKDFLHQSGIFLEKDVANQGLTYLGLL
jgi:hypothetical protein